jgi:ABC-type ATPase with predicted acetyltransferase domain
MLVTTAPNAVFDDKLRFTRMSGSIITANKISKRFGNNEVLRGVNLAVSERDVVCVIGPSSIAAVPSA